MELPIHLGGKPRGVSTFTSIVQSYIRTILTNRATRNVFFYLLLNLSFTGVEILYGMWTNSLGLIGDGLHMLFDSSALIGSLVASVIVKWPSNDRFSYGYDRTETLTGFVNSLLLLYAAASIFFESIGRLFEPPEVSTDRLLLVAVLGFIVNLVGIFAFEHGGHGHSHSHGGHGHSHDDHGHGHDDHDHGHGNNNHSNPLMQGMFLHILADTLGSVGVIVSALMIDWFGWVYADPICSLFISIMIIASVIPLLKASALVLLQRCPAALEDRLGACFMRVQKIPGVVGIAEPHFWEQSSERYIGSLKVQATPDADEQKIRILVTNIFKQAGVSSFCLQVDKAINTY